MQFPIAARASSGSFDDSLSAAQAQVAGAAEVFLAAHGGWVERTVAALCRRFGVPTQEHEDVVQETYRRLLDPHIERFVPSRGGGKQYVRGMILNAIGFAGRRRRRGYEGSYTPEVDDRPEAVAPSWREPFDHAEAHTDLSRLLRRADAFVSRAVVLVYREGLSQRDAAKVVGVSEFTLSRALRKALKGRALAA